MENIIDLILHPPFINWLLIILSFSTFLFFYLWFLERENARQFDEKINDLETLFEFMIRTMVGCFEISEQEIVKLCENLTDRSYIKKLLEYNLLHNYYEHKDKHPICYDNKEDKNIASSIAKLSKYIDIRNIDNSDKIIINGKLAISTGILSMLLQKTSFKDVVSILQNAKNKYDIISKI